MNLIHTCNSVFRTTGVRSSKASALQQKFSMSKAFNISFRTDNRMRMKDQAPVLESRNWLSIVSDETGSTGRAWTLVLKTPRYSGRCTAVLFLEGVGSNSDFENDVLF